MSKSILKKRGRRGFTLIELLIVIAIIGLLAAIMTPVFIRARFKTYHTACVQNEKNIATALELYSLENKQLYPTDLTTITAGQRPYIRKIPTCPSSATDYTSTYFPATDNKTYELHCPGFHDAQLPGMVDATYPRIMQARVFVYNASN